jgi:uncharacterized protein (DUF362 family)
MSKLTRRDFLLTLLAGMGGLAADQILTACGLKPTSFPLTTTGLPPTARPNPTSAPPATTEPAAQADTSPTDASDATSQPTPGSPYLVVARNGQPEDMLRRALAALGGMEKFVSPGARVVIKPNICVAYHSYEYAATTNPWVVGGLVKLCLEAGANSVRVMDSPFGGTAKKAYAVSGIGEQVKAAGGEMVDMPRFQYVSTSIPNGQDLRQADIFDEVLKADVLIDVPIAKHHSLAGLSLGMKNLMGVIQDRSAIHRNLGQRLADLSSLLRPTLTVVDAVRILMAGGPTGGNLDDVKQMDTLIVSPDIVAADSYAATLFGLQPDDLLYVKAAAAMGLGSKDLGRLKIEEINLNG